MTNKEKWYRFCMLCEHSYIREGDAGIVYCKVPDDRYCPHKNEIKDAERKKK